MSKRYTVAHVRERLSDALDQAERGEAVIIERHGTRFRLSVASEAPARRRRRKPRIEVLDPAVADGQWSWSWTPRSLSLQSRKRR
jgi:antitoxin (DNA-binding transcriptional repressor) of toxin-antitoxin stability system